MISSGHSGSPSLLMHGHRRVMFPKGYSRKHWDLSETQVRGLNCLSSELPCTMLHSLNVRPPQEHSSWDLGEPTSPVTAIIALVKRWYGTLHFENSVKITAPLTMRLQEDIAHPWTPLEKHSLQLMGIRSFLHSHLGIRAFLSMLPTRIFLGKIAHVSLAKRPG